jgi:tetratricopeptide (TPR) repeat protein
LDLKPDNPHNILEIAFRHYKARRFDKAEELVQKLLETDLADKAYRLLAEIAYLMDDIESALEYARKAGGNIQNELNQGTMCLEDIIGGVSMLDYYGVMAEADAQYSSGCPKRAAELLNNYCSHTGKSTPSIQYIQRFLYENDSNSKYDTAQPSEAESGHTNPFTRLEKQALLQAVEKDSDNAQVFNLLGNYYSRINSDTAHRFWSQSIRISPIDYLPLRASAYKLMRERQDLNEAVGLYESALSIKNDCPDLVCEYLTCLRLHGDLRKAMDFLDNIDKVLSGHYKIVKARISVLRDNHRFEEAVNTILASDHLHFWEGER